MASTICLNCGKQAAYKYCSHCGQATAVSRVTWKSLLEEAFHFFTHVEHGFLRTTRMAIFQPGTLPQLYLEGKRKSFSKPVAFLLVWIAISLITYATAKHITHNEHLRTASVFSGSGEIFAFYLKYTCLIETLILPFIALAAWLVFARPKLNYVEVVVVTFYHFAVSYISYVLFLIIACFFAANKTYNFYFDTEVALYLVWAVFAAYSFYKRYAKRFFVLRLILFFFLGGLIHYFGVYLICTLLIALH
ncbi:DUF3667 domain-containing protein [Flavisolibacter nicotianae]|uniref:DUF3667 domain-containing protein n=1 Tax=Flavisolibacter nicotianae TaxID=2364882 RepID=UPI0013C509C9|nr:DUF3667 domain-containing protein [Flavisolibacter nicotianae]